MRPRLDRVRSRLELQQGHRHQQRRPDADHALGYRNQQLLGPRAAGGRGDDRQQGHNRRRQRRLRENAVYPRRAGHHHYGGAEMALTYTVRIQDRLTAASTRPTTIRSSRCCRFVQTPNAPYEIHKISTGDGHTVLVQADPPRRISCCLTARPTSRSMTTTTPSEFQPAEALPGLRHFRRRRLGRRRWRRRSRERTSAAGHD